MSLFGTIFYFLYNEFKAVNTKLSAIETSLSQRMVAVETSLKGIRETLSDIKEQYKTYLEIYMKMSKSNNPHPDKGILLKKLYDGTITYDEIILLQSILEEEKQSAEASNDFVKVLVIVGVLVFIAIALSELNKK